MKASEPGRLFSPAPAPKVNAYISGLWADRYAYVNGYYHAAVVLGKCVIDGEPPDLLFYPICFNFRHCIELHLKALVYEIDSLHRVLVSLEEASDLPSKPRRMMKRHSLICLLQWTEKALEVFSDERMDKDVRRAILEFDRYDADGQAFRYHIKNDGSQSLPDESRVGIEALLNRMETVHFHLCGIDMWLADQKETAQGVLDDLSES